MKFLALSTAKFENTFEALVFLLGEDGNLYTYKTHLRELDKPGEFRKISFDPKRIQK